MFRSIEPQDNPSELQPHPHRSTLRGAPGGVAFPPLCPNCGQEANGSIDVAKVFRQADSDGPTRYTVASAAVPYCSRCIAAHRSVEVVPSPLDTVRSGFVGLNMLGAVLPALAALFLTWLALGDVVHGRGTRFVVELGIGAVFALVAWAQGVAVWRDTERFRVPPQSEVTKAFDFSGDIAPALEAARFVCTMRDAGFAAAFAALNADRKYDAGSVAAAAERRRSNRLMWIMGGVLALFALWSLWKDGLG